MSCEFCLLAHTLVVQILYASIHITLHKSLVLFLAGKMNSKNKNKIYKKIIEEVCNKYDSAKEFVNNRIKELCFQEGILINDVHKWLKTNLFLVVFFESKAVFVLKVRLTKT